MHPVLIAEVKLTEISTVCELQSFRPNGHQGAVSSLYNYVGRVMVLTAEYSVINTTDLLRSFLQGTKKMIQRLVFALKMLLVEALFLFAKNSVGKGTDRPE